MVHFKWEAPLLIIIVIVCIAIKSFIFKYSERMSHQIDTHFIFFRLERQNNTLNGHFIATLIASINLQLTGLHHGATNLWSVYDVNNKIKINVLKHRTGRHWGQTRVLRVHSQDWAVRLPPTVVE